MPEHLGRRRRQSRLPWGPVAAVAAALVVVGVLLALPDPRSTTPAPPDTTVVATPTPTFHGPVTADSAGTLPDSTAYTPRIFLSPQVSVGLAPTGDGRWLRLITRNGSGLVELRRLAAAQNPQFDAFTVSGDTLVWAETVTTAQAGTRTSIWRSAWPTAGRPVLVTTDTQDASFAGSQYDLVVNGGRVYWTAALDGGTEVRSVGLDGYDTEWQDLNGDFGLSAWPWLVSPGGRGQSVRLFNLATGATVTVKPAKNQTATCTPTWCRLDTAGGTGLTRIDVRRPQGTGAAQVSGAEATPAIADADLLDRYVPLITDQPTGTGLSLYDITTATTTLIALGVDNVRGAGGLLWWSTTDDTGMVWHAIDLRTLP